MCVCIYLWYRRHCQRCYLIAVTEYSLLYYISPILNNPLLSHSIYLYIYIYVCVCVCVKCLVCINLRLYLIFFFDISWVRITFSTIGSLFFSMLSQSRCSLSAPTISSPRLPIEVSLTLYLSTYSLAEIFIPCDLWIVLFESTTHTLFFHFLI